MELSTLLCCRTDSDRDLVVKEVIQEYSDVEAKLKLLFEECETRISNAIDELNSDAADESDCDGSDSDKS